MLGNQPQTVFMAGVEWTVSHEPPIPKPVAAPAPEGGAEYFSGLDLGQAQDPSALTVFEKTLGPDPTGKSKEPVGFYALRGLHRWPLGTPYTEIVDDMAKRFSAPPLKGTHLAVDRTGVGRPVVELLHKAGVQAQIRSITITWGHGSRGAAGGAFNVAKVELVGVLQVLLQQRRLKVAKDLPLAPILVKELQNFRVKISAAGNELFEAWREGEHDDMVLAAGCAVWLGERGRRANIW